MYSFKCVFEARHIPIVISHKYLIDLLFLKVVGDVFMQSLYRFFLASAQPHTTGAMNADSTTRMNSLPLRTL